MKFRSLMVVILLAIFLLPSEARAQSEVAWNDAWSKFSTTEYVYTGGALLGAASIELFWEELDEPLWTGPFLFDGSMKQILTPTSLEGQDLAATLSDLLVWSLIFYPVADAVWTGGFVHRDPTVSSQLLLMNVESFATTALVVQLGKVLIGRERPGRGACYENPDIKGCERKSTKSHPSGHTAMAFTGAALTCVHHSRLPLYGGGGADRIACAAAMGAAAATGLLRIAANRHFFSDVIAGAGVGLASGFLLPILLHYSRKPGGFDSREEALESGAGLQVDPVVPVLQFGGAF